MKSKSKLGTTAWDQQISGRADIRKLGLRFDRVVTGLVDQLRSALESDVPDGMTVMVTITAPILLPSKTAAVLEDKIRARVQRAPVLRDLILTVHGNRVRIRVLKGIPNGVPKIIGLVHNADRDARLLLDLFSPRTQSIDTRNSTA